MKPNRPILTAGLFFMLIAVMILVQSYYQKPVTRNIRTTETRDTAMDWWVRLRTSERHKRAIGDTVKTKSIKDYRND